MAKNAQVFIQWDTKDRWNGVKQYVKRKDVKPYEESLRCGQEVKLKWASRWYKVIMCEDWSPKKRKSKKILYNLIYFLIQKLLTPEINVLMISRIISVLNSTATSDSSTEAVVTDEDIPLSAHVLRTATDEAGQYKNFLQKQSRMQESWNEQRRKRVATGNPAPVQPTQKETPLLRAIPPSPMKTSAMAKEVPVAMVPASPRREKTAETELQETENLKEELKKEKASVQKIREEYTKRLADLRHREEQANSAANIGKVTCLLLYFKFAELVVNTKLFKFIATISLPWDAKIPYDFIRASIA